MTPFEIVWKLHTLGYSMIPSGGGESYKTPLVNWAKYQNRKPTDDELRKWEDELHPKLWGIVTGKISGLVVVDADTLDARKKLETEIMPPHVVTPGGGAHWYFRHPGSHVKTVAPILPGMDIRADGGFVNIAGTRPDGEYKILTLPAPDNLILWDRLPGEIKQAMNNTRTSKAISGINTASRLIKEGERNDRLFRMACGMRGRGASEDTIYDAVKSCYQNDCEHEPSISEDELHKIASRGAQYPPNSGIHTNTYTYNASGQIFCESKRDRKRDI